MNTVPKPNVIEPFWTTLFQRTMCALGIRKRIADIDTSIRDSPTIDSVPVVCRDGGPQFDRADVPTAEAEAILGREFETEKSQERVL